MARRRSRRSRGAASGSNSMLLVIIAVVSVVLVAGLLYLGYRQPGGDGGSLNVAELDLTGFPAKGDPEAPVTMVEFSDYGCSHCRAFVLEKADQIDEAFIETGMVRYVVHPFHLNNSPYIALATEAAWCADDQDKFFEYQRVLFERQGTTFDPEVLTEIAAELDLDREQFVQCLADETYRSQVEEARQIAASLGINSTPTFIINDETVRGNESFLNFQRVIEQEAAQAQ